MPVYMDHAATTALSEKALEAMLPFFREEYGNPSAVYDLGQTAKNAMEKCRARMAACLGALPTEIFFTSGGTESDNWVLRGVCRAKRQKGRHVITTAFEHNAVLRTLEQMEQDGLEVTRLEPDRQGRITALQLEEAIRPDTVLISVMLANNVVGTVLDVPALARVARSRRVPFHTDAVQAVGHIPVDVRKLGVDFLSLSAHKFNGPKGVGAVYCRLPNRLPPLLTGGGQEKELRSGTENVPGIAGMTAALEEALAEMDGRTARLRRLQERMISGVLALPGIHLTGDPENRLPGFCSFIVEGIFHSVYLVNEMNERGFCVSSGSACSAASRASSHVLLALGYDKALAGAGLRITLGAENTERDVDRALTALREALEKVRKEKPPGAFLP
ncbi:MAG: cysteine desulfurase [Oscillospiraceae bacterium]|nr:cysteine desulfurase [Oscillospiraceae bacterium]